MFCTNCGDRLRDGVKFCEECGMVVEDDDSGAATAPAPEPPRTREFSCKAVEFSIFRYSDKEFGDMDLCEELGKWKYEFEHNATVAPLFVGSIMDHDPRYANLKVTAITQPEAGSSFVVVYRRYDGATFAIAEDAGDNWVLHLHTLASALKDEQGIKFRGPMLQVSKDDREERFQRLEAGIASELMAAFFEGATQSFECTFKDLQAKVDEARD